MIYFSGKICVPHEFIDLLLNPACKKLFTCPYSVSMHACPYSTSLFFTWKEDLNTTNRIPTIMITMSTSRKLNPLFLYIIYLRINKWSDDISVYCFIFIHQNKRFLIIDDVEYQFFTFDIFDEVRDIFSIDSKT